MIVWFDAARGCQVSGGWRVGSQDVSDRKVRPSASPLPRSTTAWSSGFLASACASSRSPAVMFALLRCCEMTELGQEQTFSMTGSERAPPGGDKVFRSVLGCAALALSCLAAVAEPGHPASSSASATSFGDMTTSPKARQADQLVLMRPEVQAWATAVRQAGRSVVIRDDSVQGRPDCIDVTLYEDATQYLTRFGTWQVCGAVVLRSQDD